MKWLSLGERMVPASMKPMLTGIGLLCLRVGLGLMMVIAHGWPKLANFGAYSKRFPDPIGMGKTLSLTLAVGAEVGCSILLILGLMTRLAAIPLLITMLVAAFVIHGSDPWSKKEFALLYALPFLMLIFTGGGRYTLEAWLGRK